MTGYENETSTDHYYIDCRIYDLCHWIYDTDGDETVCEDMDYCFGIFLYPGTDAKLVLDKNFKEEAEEATEEAAEGEEAEGSEETEESEEAEHPAEEESTQ